MKKFIITEKVLRASCFSHGQGKKIGDFVDFRVWADTVTPSGTFTDLDYDLSGKCLKIALRKGYIDRYSRLTHLGWVHL